MLRATTLLALAGCFSQPRAPASSDATAPSGDGLDSGGTACGMWAQAPTPIALQLATGASARDPWLSDDRNTVYFTVLSMTNTYSIQRALWDGMTWQGPMLELSTAANPFIADDGSLWFDNASATPMLAYATPNAGGFAIAASVMPGRQPSLSPSGNVLYYTAAATADVYRSTRASSSVSFDAGVMLVHGTNGITDPSISADGTQLYLTEATADGERIYVATFDTNNTLLEGVVLPFQTEIGSDYFAPNISRDGKTLVFAYRKSGASLSTLAYVTRSCN